MKKNHLLCILIILLLGVHSYAGEKVLKVLTRNSPTTLYYGSDNSMLGFEHDLVQAFAKDNGYKVKFIVKHSIKEVLESLTKGEADFAAAGLTRTKEREKLFFMGPSYLNVQEQVVCGYGKTPKNIKELMNYKIEIITMSSYVESMNLLKSEYPELKWKEHEGYTTEHIFDRIDKKKVDCTVADSHIIAINRRYYPQLHVSFPISEQQFLAWMMPKRGGSYELVSKMNLWFKKFKKSQRFAMIKDHYFSHVEIFDYVDISVYHKRIKNRLPKYIASFRRGGKKYGIDWRLLAAQAYQESHWNPRAKSPTGVRGMMMLTLSTAKAMDVKNRLNYRESIDGGAKYLVRQIEHVPKGVKSMSDREKFALAAYNIGRGHMYDAIRLGKILGKDPYVWMNMKEILPMLSERKYYKKLKYGYARGREPVRYVTRINNYFDILKQYYKK
jgi:membrane-bound lytic murein transglycosylase F